MNDYTSSSSKVNPAQVFPVEEKTDGVAENGSATGKSSAQNHICNLYDQVPWKKIDY